MKKKAIFVLAILLIPTIAFGWDNRDDQLMADIQRNAELREIANEMRYAQEYKEYQDDLQEYNDSFRGREWLKPMADHYFQGPRPPQR
jgi:hypothetical protein